MACDQCGTDTRIVWFDHRMMPWRRGERDILPPDRVHDANREGGNSMMTLDCGCRLGVYLCPEAEILWRAMELKFREGMKSGDFRAYDAAAATYSEHVNGDSDGRVCTGGSTA
jgi:hypothetical protein